MTAEGHTIDQQKTEGLPLVTFVVFAYKQDGFVREAVEGALAQTYSPLEIIISDDHSPDQTFEVMKKAVASYDGPHEVILNRNENNLGIGGHVNKLMDMARGELIVIAAGDDISLPERTEKTVRAWLDNGRPTGICSEVSVINDDGELLNGESEGLHFDGVRKGMISPGEIVESYLSGDRYWVTGCSAAWAKRSWELFGNYNRKAPNEDMIMSLRAGLSGGIYLMEDELVLYRKHDENISFARKTLRKRSYATSVSRAVGHADRMFQLFTVNKEDLETAERKIGGNGESYDLLGNYIERELKRHDVARKWWSYGFAQKIKHWRSSPFTSVPLRVISLFGETSYRLSQYGINQCKYYLAR